MEIGHLVKTISDAHTISKNHALLVGISGIDASGKGYIAAKTISELSGLNVALIHADGWLNLPNIRFDRQNPAENFYKNGIRLDEMFRRLVLPLRDNRCVEVSMDHLEETATEFRPHTYRFSDIDIIILEGIFLFKRPYLDHFDLKIWIDCPFEKALERAISRSQEGLSAEETKKGYESIYFPAQRIHFDIDAPAQAADLILENW